MIWRLTNLKRNLYCTSEFSKKHVITGTIQIAYHTINSLKSIMGKYSNNSFKVLVIWFSFTSVKWHVVNIFWTAVICFEILKQLLRQRNILINGFTRWIRTVIAHLIEMILYGLNWLLINAYTMIVFVKWISS